MLYRYRVVANHFRKNFPVKVYIRRVKLNGDDWGSTDRIRYYRKSFHICIDSKLDDVASVMVLLHELAHALSWTKDKHPSDHGPEFGRAYSRVYRMYLNLLEHWPAR
jgi:predicted SprT family Zn-dependent metalloprotease